MGISVVERVLTVMSWRRTGHVEMPLCAQMAFEINWMGFRLFGSAGINHGLRTWVDGVQHICWSLVSRAADVRDGARLYAAWAPSNQSAFGTN